MSTIWVLSDGETWTAAQPTHYILTEEEFEELECERRVRHCSWYNKPPRDLSDYEGTEFNVWVFEDGEDWEEGDELTKINLTDEEYAELLDSDGPRKCSWWESKLYSN